jgi:hypothetical protein
MDLDVEFRFTVWLKFIYKPRSGCSNNPCAWCYHLSPPLYLKKGSDIMKGNAMILLHLFRFFTPLIML